jgi:four helix bundle protein
MRRAATSIALNVAEGMYSRGKNKGVRFHTALGSAREAMAYLEVAAALGYVAEPDEDTMQVLNRIVGTLVRLADRTR